jgi:hypothetical protein
MRDAIFKGVATALAGVAPIVLGRELLEAALFGRRGRAGCVCVELGPTASELPFILGCLDRAGHVDAMLHGETYIVFSIRKSSDQRHGPFGNDLGDKNHTSSLLILFFAANVESQVHLVKIGVKGNGKVAKDLGVAKPEANQADVCPSLK